jgi:predicted transcriptional regulator
MEITKKGFTINYDIQEMGLIKPGGSGTMENGFNYPASVKIKSSNIIQDEDEELGLVDKEELIEFKIVCESNVQANEINKMFRTLKQNGVVVHFDGSLPKKYQNSEYLQVTVLNTAQQLMEKYHKDMKQEVKKTS